MILDIIKYGDANFGKLKQKSIDVKKENPFLQKLIDDMFETLESSNSGIGLAAPQVGHNLNLFIIKLKDFKEVFINPQILTEGLNIQIKEGCLSFSNLEFPVNRKEKVKIKYYDRNWNYRLIEAEKLLSIVIQHEYDHLQGKLILD
jgi:peptide deformylase